MAWGHSVALDNPRRVERAKLADIDLLAVYHARHEAKPQVTYAITGALAATEAPDTAALAGTVQRAQGGGFFPLFRPAPVSGHGYGILPRLVGDAHGEVVIAGVGAATVPIVATAAGEVDDDIELIALLLMLAA